MSDNEAPETEQENDSGESEEFDKERALAKIKKSNAEAAGLRKRLKELEPKLKQFDEWQESQKSELEKLQGQLEAAVTRASTLEAEKLRRDVAAEKGLSASQAKWLQGSTLEELNSSADELLSDFKATKIGKPTVSSLKGGSDPSSDKPFDPKDIASRVLNRNRF